MADLESLTKSIGTELFSLTQKEARLATKSYWWKEKAITWFMRDEELRNALLRFTDVFPMLRDKQEINEHFIEYFTKGLEKPPIIFRVANTLTRFSPGSEIVAWLTKLAVRKVAQHFITGTTPEETIKVIRKIQEEGAAFTLNSLGEATLSELEAEEYMARYLSLMESLTSVGDQNYSIKYSSLYSQFDPIDCDGGVAAVKEKYRRILRKAKEVGAFINTDSEPYYSLDLTQQIFMETLNEEEFRDFADAGIVLQAYLRDSEDRLRNMISWAKAQVSTVTIRLVKGAYWDTEVIAAKEKGWPIPVFTRKWETDMNFEKLADILLENYPIVRTAWAVTISVPSPTL